MRSLAGCTMALAALAAPALAAPPADLVLRGGIVHTEDAARPQATAVAVRAGAIVAVGGDADVASLVGPSTRVVELAGRTVIPGLVESHGHLLALGRSRMQLDLVGTRSWDEVVERLRAAVKGRAAGEWIEGRGWHEGKWDAPAAGSVRGFPTNALLTSAAPDNPVLLERADGHAVIANAAALRSASITRDTKAPEGGEIVRFPDGTPTGVLVDNATDLVHVPPPTDADRKRALDLAAQEALSKGITTFVDAGEDLPSIALLRREAEAGALSMRLYVMVMGLDNLKAFGPPQIGLGGGFLTVRSVKLVADGALGSRGAALLEPYSDDPGNSGFFVTPKEVVLETARYGLEHGFQVNVHAIGDRANRMVLDQFEAAFREHPAAKDPRYRIEHAQILDAADIPRFAKLGVIASMQGVHATSDRPWAPQRLGMARITEGAYVWRSLLKTGARIVNGTDAPVEDVSPIRSFYASVTRQDEAGNPPEGFDPGQRMTREEALRSYTAEAAYGTFTERTLGTIAVGKRADLTVLTKDILAVPAREILDARVAYTIVDGRIRYEAR